MARGDATIDGYICYLRDVRRLSPNTIESYARDLGALAAFAEKKGQPVDRSIASRPRGVCPAHLMSAACRRARSRARLPASRGYYRFLLLEQQIAPDPAEDLRAPRAWPALPKYLGLDEVDRLLAAAGSRRRRAACATRRLIELLYATGLRVTELLSLKPGDVHLDARLPDLHRQGHKQRIVPLGQQAADWVRRYCVEARPGAAQGAQPRRGCS